MNLQDYINKYSTLRNIKRFNMECVHQPQDLCSHGYSVATIFYLLCEELHITIPSTVLFKVLNHDFAETYTGDLNRRIKDKNEQTQKAWDILEKESLPKHLKNWTDEGLKNCMTKDLYELLQIADELDAFIFCCEEIRKGNSYMDKPKFYYQLKLLERITHKSYPIIKRVVHHSTGVE